MNDQGTSKIKSEKQLIKQNEKQKIASQKKYHRYSNVSIIGKCNQYCYHCVLEEQINHSINTFLIQTKQIHCRVIVITQNFINQKQIYCAYKDTNIKQFIMGTAASKEDFFHTEIEKQFEILKSYKDRSLGDVKILQDKQTHQQYLLRQMTTSDEKQVQSLQEKLTQRKLLKHPNIISISQILHNVEDEVCANIHRVYVLFEYCSNNLDFDIQIRKNADKKFAQSEIKKVLQGAVSGLRFLQQRNLSHQSIKPRSLFLTDSQIVQLIEPSYFGHQTHFENLFNSQSDDTQNYIDPFLLDSFNSENFNPQCNVFKNDVFSLGLSILHMALLTDLDDCYTHISYTKRQFDHSLKDQRIQSLQNMSLYSDDLIQIIKVMLNPEIEKRPDFIELSRLLTDLDDNSDQKSSVPASAKPNISNRHTIGYQPNNKSNNNRGSFQPNLEYKTDPEEIRRSNISPQRIFIDRVSYIKENVQDQQEQHTPRGFQDEQDLGNAMSPSIQNSIQPLNSGYSVRPSQINQPAIERPSQINNRSQLINKSARPSQLNPFVDRVSHISQRPSNINQFPQARISYNSIINPRSFIVPEPRLSAIPHSPYTQNFTLQDQNLYLDPYLSQSSIPNRSPEMNREFEDHVPGSQMRLRPEQKGIPNDLKIAKTPQADRLDQSEEIYKRNSEHSLKPKTHLNDIFKAPVYDQQYYQPRLSSSKSVQNLGSYPRREDSSKQNNVSRESLKKQPYEMYIENDMISPQQTENPYNQRQNILRNPQSGRRQDQTHEDYNQLLPKINFTIPQNYPFDFTQQSNDTWDNLRKKMEEYASPKKNLQSSTQSQPQHWTEKQTVTPQAINYHSQQREKQPSVYSQRLTNPQELSGFETPQIYDLKFSPQPDASTQSFIQPNQNYYQSTPSIADFQMTRFQPQTTQQIQSPPMYRRVQVPQQQLSPNQPTYKIVNNPPEQVLRSYSPSRTVKTEPNYVQVQAEKAPIPTQTIYADKRPYEVVQNPPPRQIYVMANKPQNIRPLKTSSPERIEFKQEPQFSGARTDRQPYQISRQEIVEQPFYPEEFDNFKKSSNSQSRSRSPITGKETKDAASSPRFQIIENQTIKVVELDTKQPQISNRFESPIDSSSNSDNELISQRSQRSTTSYSKKSNSPSRFSFKQPLVELDISKIQQEHQKLINEKNREPVSNNFHNQHNYHPQGNEELNNKITNQFTKSRTSIMEKNEDNNTLPYSPLPFRNTIFNVGNPSHLSNPSYNQKPQPNINVQPSQSFELSEEVKKIQESLRKSPPKRDTINEIQRISSKSAIVPPIEEAMKYSMKGKESFKPQMPSENRPPSFEQGTTEFFQNDRYSTFSNFTSDFPRTTQSIMDNQFKNQNFNPQTQDTLPRNEFSFIPVTLIDVDKDQNRLYSFEEQLNESMEKKQIFVKETYQDGTSYEGEQINGAQFGYGQFFYRDGGRYEGEWANDQMHGEGTLYYNNGQPAYIGNWKYDQFAGQGILYNSDIKMTKSGFNFENFDLVDEIWQKFDGEFRNDMKNGFGILYLSNGEKFSGNFKDDNVDGYGEYSRLNGETVNGKWENNHLVSLNS